MTTPGKGLDNLINSLLVKTREGRLPWFTTASPLSYSVAFSSSSVTIRRAGPTVFPDYVLSIQNDSGEEIETCTAFTRTDPRYSALEELFKYARRKATAVDETIAQIQEELAEV
ncbi:MAG: hypothetical protein F4045_07650 [Chloroflexi bacterium]|nr:hypothetical protein [Chloroflexota bacterium]MYK34970.1 hypothetical protein [Chloroflexota bacterium]